MRSQVGIAQRQFRAIVRNGSGWRCRVHEHRGRPVKEAFKKRSDSFLSFNRGSYRNLPKPAFHGFPFTSKKTSVGIQLYSNWSQHRFHSKKVARRAILMEKPAALKICASGRWVDLSQRRSLGLEELSYARSAQSQHLAELTVVEGRFLARALQLDEFLGLGHCYV